MVLKIAPPAALPPSPSSPPFASSTGSGRPPPPNFHALDREMGEIVWETTLTPESVFGGEIGSGALVDGKLVNFVVPYPMGFFAKNVDGRIDDPNAGWKGRELWTTYGTRTMFHLEGGRENRPKAVRLQLRPDPLAH